MTAPQRDYIILDSHGAPLGVDTAESREAALDRWNRAYPDRPATDAVEDEGGSVPDEEAYDAEDW
jgi:hypothetical protein